MDDMLSPPLAGAVASSRRLILLTLCLAVLVAQADTFIVNLAVRPIGDYFGSGVGEPSGTTLSQPLAQFCTCG